MMSAALAPVSEESRWYEEMPWLFTNRLTATVVMISRRSGWWVIRSPKRSRSSLGKYWTRRSARYGSSGRSLATTMSASRIFVHASSVASSGLHSPSPAAILRVISEVVGIVSRCRSRYPSSDSTRIATMRLTSTSSSLVNRRKANVGKRRATSLRTSRSASSAMRRSCPCGRRFATCKRTK